MTDPMERTCSHGRYPEEGCKECRALRDWPEDFEDENGRYLNFCVSCDLEFLGHKRRVLCKLCQPRRDET